MERLAAIVASSDDAIIGQDLHGVITNWNQGAKKIFGYTAPEAIGKSIEFLLPPERMEEEAFIFNKILKGERASHFETERICKKGGRIALSATISPIFDSNGKVVGASRITRDITIQKKEAQALLDANKELVYENEEKAKRVDELVIANEGLLFQNEEKTKQAPEFVIANEEKAKRAAELVIANEEKAKLEAFNTGKLYLSLMETIDIARQLVELRDPYTAGHEKHVGELAKAIAAEMGFDASRQEGLLITGYLHDIGKIIVPVEILSKPGKITPAEYGLIKNHVQASHDLLKNVTFPWEISRAILEHHERLDGSGYPNQLKGDQISIEGRILAVADVVEAMSSYRPYRPALGIEAALAEIERGRGSLYDEKVVDACLKLFREKDYKIAADVH